MSSEAQSIELANVEPALPDLDTAQRLALAARTEREQAEQAVTTAKAERDSAKAEYIASPTPEGDEACERGEVAVRRAERYAEAMFARLTTTEKTLTDAKRAAAIGDLSETGAERDGIRCELAEQLHVLRNLHAHAAQTIAKVESICSRDFAVCEKATKSARAAGIAGAARPVDLELVRHSLGIWLTGGRPRRSHHLTVDGARPMMTLLAEINTNERLTPDERGAALRLVVDEYLRAAGAGASDVSDWLCTRHAPPQALNHTAAASRHRQAHALLMKIFESEGEPKQ